MNVGSADVLVFADPNKILLFKWFFKVQRMLADPYGIILYVNIHFVRRQHMLVDAHKMDKIR